MRRKKADLQKKAETAPKYGKPRAPKKPKPPTLSKKGKPITPASYRAKGRNEIDPKTGQPHRLPKQPKTPKADMKKGERQAYEKAKKEAASSGKPMPPANQRLDKALRTQQEANERKKAKLAAGRDKFKDAAAAQKKTDGLPDRKTTYTALGGEKFTGKDARVAVFNSHHFANEKVNHKPVEFRNDVQGPPDNKHRPFPNMKGSGQEFPMVAGKSNGYQGRSDDIGVARVITQKNGDRTQFMGAVAHDSTKTKEDPGRYDHHEMKPVPGPR